jgi:hypothetical protein
MSREDEDIIGNLNPVCTVDEELPPPPDNCLLDPAEPHPDEPGAPEDAPAIRSLRIASA